MNLRIFIGVNMIWVFLDIFKNQVNYNNILFIICLPLALIGFIDDRVNLNRGLRYLIQLVVVTLLFLANINLDQTFIYELINYKFIAPLVVFIFIFIGTGFINLVNFMDGIDGLVASCIAITSIFIGISQNNLMLILSASIVGFLFLNWHPAKIFMGDIGSTYLGGILVATVFYSKDLTEFINIFLLNMPLLADAFICLIIRAYKGQNIFIPHKLHLYQRLTQNGWSHSLVSIVYALSTSILGLSVILGNIFITIFISFVILTLGFWLNDKHATKFLN